MADQFELVFSNSAMQDRFPAYRRWHTSTAGAIDESHRVIDILLNPNYGVPAHSVNPVIYGPGLDDAGMPVAR
jgi:hypothetical protein